MLIKTLINQLSYVLSKGDKLLDCLMLSRRLVSISALMRQTLSEQICWLIILKLGESSMKASQRFLIANRLQTHSITKRIFINANKLFQYFLSFAPFPHISIKTKWTLFRRWVNPWILLKIKAHQSVVCFRVSTKRNTDLYSFEIFLWLQFELFEVYSKFEASLASCWALRSEESATSTSKLWNTIEFSIIHWFSKAPMSRKQQLHNLHDFSHLFSPTDFPLLRNGIRAPFCFQMQLRIEATTSTKQSRRLITQ
jgi:hypothetical protein